ncbi:hypothetical protein ACWD3I_46900 [Streptomyces sp. NPDC002817]|uniref:hypothetical protein n=1 Tax=Streptomyces sp. NPDC088357 TaxID=3154655 RepID=UPI00344685D5
MSRITQSTTYSGITWALLALGLAFSPCTETIMGACPEDELAVGGADNDTVIECGRSFGIAILGSALFTYYADQPTDRSATPTCPQTCSPTPLTR